VQTESGFSVYMEYFDQQTIQPSVLKKFRQSFINKRLAHAYIFYGTEGCGKEAFALEMAMALNCSDEKFRPCHQCPSCHKISQFNHPDVKFVIPQVKSWTSKDIQKRYQLKALNPFSRIDFQGPASIGIDKIRELKNESKFTPYEAEKKIYIITEAEKMNRESANSFLKLLEEPPDNLLIILITSTIHALLDTIKSRCQAVYFPPLTLDAALAVVSNYRQLTDMDRRLVQIAQGNLKEIFDMQDRETDDKRKLVYEFLRAAARGTAKDLSASVDSIAFRKDKNFLLDILNLLILWIKDTICILAYGGETQIINIDYKDEIHRFAQSYAPSDFDSMIAEIEKSISAVKANVHMPLTLMVLGTRIHHYLRRAKTNAEKDNVT
jgi:DNA polymerase-3 subunit delta'